MTNQPGPADTNELRLPMTYTEVMRAVGERTRMAVKRQHLNRLILAREASAELARQLRAAEEEVACAAVAAYEAGDSWHTMGVVLGVSRQAAQQRYGGRIWADSETDGVVGSAVGSAEGSGEGSGEKGQSPTQNPRPPNQSP